VSLEGRIRCTDTYTENKRKELRPNNPSPNQGFIVRAKNKTKKTMFEDVQRFTENHSVSLLEKSFRKDSKPNNK
jgi:hypothetical protein